jgi:hypothetical protein
MAESSTERLRTYLAALPPRAQSLLMREFERAIERGDNATVATYVLGELRQVARTEEAQSTPRIDDPMRLVFRPLEPFLTDSLTERPGTIRRSVLLQVWQWLKRDGAPAAVARLTAALDVTGTPERSADRGFAISDFQRAAAIALSTAAVAPPSEQKTLLARIGPTAQPEDLALIADLLRARDALDGLALRLPTQVREFGPSQAGAVEAALSLPALQVKSLMPFALSLAMSRMQMPWQIFRLATRAADSDSEFRVASKPQAIAVTMAIQYLAGIAAELREDLQRARFDQVSGHLKTLHDGVRGILAEIDIRQDSAWGRQVAALRADISNALRVYIEGLPGRVRRILRQRSNTDITPATRLDATEIEETVALMQIVETCRAYAEELAVNEASNRARAELAQYVGPTTDAVIAALRGCDARTIAFRRQQADAAIAFSGVLFGAEHAARMQRSADKAMAEEPQAKSA